MCKSLYSLPGHKYFLGLSRRGRVVALQLPLSLTMVLVAAAVALLNPRNPYTTRSLMPVCCST